MSPKISVILAAYNEEKLLPRCLKTLQDQTYPRELFEVILVDNNSSDKTSQIGRQYGVKVVEYKDVQGCGPARKFGSKIARGEIFAFTDPDCIVPPNWLEKIDSQFMKNGVQLIGGKGMADRKDILIRFPFVIADWFYLLNNFFGKPLIWGYNMAVKKTAYDAIGGINIELLSSEDWDLAFRIHKKFGRGSVKYLRSLEVATYPRKQNNPKVLFRYFKNGVKNYIDYVILGKVKAIPIFNVR